MRNLIEKIARQEIWSDFFRDDAVQEVHIAYSKLKVKPANPRGWIKRALVNKLRNMQRKFINDSSGSEERLASVIVDKYAPFEFIEIKDLVTDNLAYEHLILGKTLREIAAETGIAYQDVRATVNEVKKNLREFYEDRTPATH